MFAAPRPRALLAALFVLLLLGMQHEVQVHALQHHLGAALHSAHDQGLQRPVADLACLECALLAGGAPVIADTAASHAASVAPFEHTALAITSRTPAAPSYYSSRAPPSPL